MTPILLGAAEGRTSPTGPTGQTSPTSPTDPDAPLLSLEEAVARVPTELRVAMEELLRAQFREVRRWSPPVEKEEKAAAAVEGELIPGPQWDEAEMPPEE